MILALVRRVTVRSNFGRTGSESFGAGQQWFGWDWWARPSAVATGSTFAAEYPSGTQTDRRLVAAAARGGRAPIEN